MKKRGFLFLTVFLCACVSSTIKPENFAYKEILTDTFTLYSYQKILTPNKPIKIYIEGDGFAFNHRGIATKDPTPRSYFLRNLAFSDNNQNVVYLARPCQYILNKNPICSKRHWTTARFAPEVVRSMSDAVKQIAGQNEVILIGFSGGAQIAGLIGALNPDIKVKKIITIAGNLDHLTWTQHHNLPSLTESMSLEDYRSIFIELPQIHYVGTKDNNTTPEITKNFIKNEKLIVEVDGASHNKGWEKIYPAVISEN